MPTFSEEVTVRITIDPEDYLEGCNEYCKHRLIDGLIEEGYINKNAREEEPNYSIAEAQYEESLAKLRGKWNSLTSEEEGIIIELAKRF